MAVGEEEQEPAVLFMQVEDVTEAVQNAACYLWPKCSTQKFGSQATQLSMPGSDVDLVILNTDFGSSLSVTERFACRFIKFLPTPLVCINTT